MFTQGSHADIKSSLDAIGAAVAVFSLDDDDRFTLVSANDTFAQAFELDVLGSIGKRLNEMFPRYITGSIEAADARVREPADGARERTAHRHPVAHQLVAFCHLPIIPEQSRITRIIVTAIDITAKSSWRRRSR